ncbi:MAG: hypothetical protein NTX28_12865 [Novosphingobium sp.]|nr:hypothetical protein [Novosphingobium sp.]
MTKKSAKPVDLEGGSAGQNDKLYAATSNQSVVTPEQYPAEEREAQKEIATGRPAKEDDR